MIEAIHPGNSGGPAREPEGEVIGRRTDSNQPAARAIREAGFAVPVNVAKGSARRFEGRQGWHPGGAYLGVGIQPFTQDRAGQFGSRLPSGSSCDRRFPDSPVQRPVGIQAARRDCGVRRQQTIDHERHQLPGFAGPEPHRKQADVVVPAGM